ncbi:MAG: ATP-dependent Clp protease ATP-binding subunit [Patescibacteria group bacterium]
MPNLLFCPTCKGVGGVAGEVCPDCRGISVGTMEGGIFLFWGRRLSPKAIRFERAASGFRGVLNFLLLLAGIAGAVALTLIIVRTGVREVLTVRFFSQPHPLLLLFWISVWLDLYLIYRLAVEGEAWANLPQKRYGEKVGAPSITDWNEAKRLPKRLQFDVSRAFSGDALGTINRAVLLASERGHGEVRLAHLFLALLAARKTGFIAGRLGLSIDGLRERTQRALAEVPAGAVLKITEELWGALFSAFVSARAARRSRADTPDLFLAVAIPEGIVKEILYDLEVDGEKLRNVVLWIRTTEDLIARVRGGRVRARLRPKHEAGRAMTALATPYLDRFSDDLTAYARAGYLPPMIGREKELAQIFRVLEGGRKSVVLVGPSGVGKEMILFGIAERMVEEDVPKVLREKRLVALSVPKLVSGATPAEAAERLLKIFYEIRRAGSVVVAVHGVEGLAGISTGGERSLDLAGVLADELGKGYFLLIATVRPDGYRTLEGTQLGNALEKVPIEEPDANEAIQMLEAAALSIEARNKVFFSYAAIAQAIALSSRYMPDRALPEKAIEIIREVAEDVRGKRGERSVVTSEDVAVIVAEKTRAPVTAVTGSERGKLLTLEARMHERVIGQDEAVKMVAAAIRRARAELREAKRPIANFLFLGPTGVGKTELAKTVAAVYFGDEEAMIRLDMSEYQDAQSVGRLIGTTGGAPGGMLTEAVRKRPFTVLLLDEIEKAHLDILNVFLQVMDDGRLTDNAGRTVDFTNIILIATSNAGTQFIQDEIKKGTAVEAIRERLVNEELKSAFRPEFLNRFDGIIVFKPLTKPEIEQIAWLMIGKVQEQLAAKGIALQVTDAAVRELAEAGFDPSFGARPLRRVIAERVQDALANFLLQEKIGRRDTVILEPGGKIRIEKAKKL